MSLDSGDVSSFQAAILIENLKQRGIALEEALAQARKEAKMAQMQKDIETERVRKTQFQLQETQSELSRANKVQVQLRIKLEEQAAAISDAKLGIPVEVRPETQAKASKAPKAVNPSLSVAAPVAVAAPVVVAAPVTVSAPIPVAAPVSAPESAPESAPVHVGAAGEESAKENQTPVRRTPTRVMVGKAHASPRAAESGPRVATVERSNVNECAQQ